MRVLFSAAEAADRRHLAGAAVTRDAEAAGTQRGDGLAVAGGVGDFAVGAERQALADQVLRRQQEPHRLQRRAVGIDLEDVEGTVTCSGRPGTASGRPCRPGAAGRRHVPPCARAAGNASCWRGTRCAGTRRRRPHARRPTAPRRPGCHPRVAASFSAATMPSRGRQYAVDDQPQPAQHRRRVGVRGDDAVEIEVLDDDRWRHVLQVGRRIANCASLGVLRL